MFEDKMMERARFWDEEHISPKRIWWWLSGAKNFCREDEWMVLHQMQAHAELAQKVEEYNRYV